MLSRPGTNYTERNCMKRSMNDFGNFNQSTPEFLTGIGGFGLGDVKEKPEIIPADRPSFSGGTVRFPTATDSRFPSFGSFGGGDSIDRLPNKNNPPIRIPPTSI